MYVSGEFAKRENEVFSSSQFRMDPDYISRIHTLRGPLWLSALSEFWGCGPGSLSQSTLPPTMLQRCFSFTVTKYA